MLAGPVAPPMTQGVTERGWPSAAKDLMPRQVSASRINGEVLFSTAMRQGRSDHPAPQMISAVLTAASAKSSPKPRSVGGLSLKREQGVKSPPGPLLLRDVLRIDGEADHVHVGRHVHHFGDGHQVG